MEHRQQRLGRTVGAVGHRPRALRIATPAAHLTGGRRGTEAGIFLAGQRAIDTATSVDTIVLDKNGTVTTGELSVLAIEPVETEHLRNLRWFAGALAHTSTHPVAKAISKLSGRGKVTQIVVHDGEGLSGSVDRHPVRLGRPVWIGIEAMGGLGVETAVEVDGRILGRIIVGDTIRPDARQGVDQRGRSMSTRSWSPTFRRQTQRTWPRRVVSRRCTRSSPPRTASFLIEKLKSNGRTVAMVGAGEANVGALGLADLAVTEADGPPGRGIGLSQIDVQSVHDAIVLARSTFSTASSNRRWAMVGMLAPVPFAAAGLIAPMYAPLLAVVCMLAMAVNSSKTARVGHRNH
ncbi:HAD family hydrolase [Aeromicrobium sp. UC242_57]|uniref:HAD family hydrolase n=1 Tax=Aeromicrobium sp. UC242_57 TaxID=3374624 RepID=UPI0037882A09